MPEEGKRIKPLADLMAVWEHDCSDYPDLIRVPMHDGKVVNYRRDLEQPHPAFVAAMDVLKRMPMYGGYKAGPIQGKEKAR